VKMTSPSAERNIGPIGDVLADWLPASGTVLELASGTGEHGLAFARRFRGLTWQPSDPDAEARASIAAWQAEAGVANFLPPLDVDASADVWPVERADVIMVINMVHISPWAATLGLLRAATRLLPDDGALILYGPYLEAEVETAPSNLAFDESLKSRNPLWGIRRREDVEKAALEAGLAFAGRRAMPANNLMLFFRKIAATE
jgi:hypothetical protein